MTHGCNLNLESRKFYQDSVAKKKKFANSKFWLGSPVLIGKAHWTTETDFPIRPLGPRYGPNLTPAQGALTHTVGFEKRLSYTY